MALGHRIGRLPEVEGDSGKRFPAPVMPLQQTAVLEAQGGKHPDEPARIGGPFCYVDRLLSRRNSDPVGNIREECLGEGGMRRPPQLRRQLPSKRPEPTEQLRRRFASERIEVFNCVEQHPLTEIFEIDEPVTGSIGLPQLARRCGTCHQLL